MKNFPEDLTKILEIGYNRTMEQTVPQSTSDGQNRRTTKEKET